MLHLLVDTSTCLDLAQRRDGQRWIVALRALIHQGEVKLLVPPVIIEEFDRNEARVQATMTASIASRFKQIRQDLVTYGSDDDAHAVDRGRPVQPALHRQPGARRYESDCQ